MCFALENGGDRMERRSSGMCRGPSRRQDYCASWRQPLMQSYDFYLAPERCFCASSWNELCAPFAHQLCERRIYSSYWPHVLRTAVPVRGLMACERPAPPMYLIGLRPEEFLGSLARNGYTLFVVLTVACSTGLVGTTSQIDIHLADLRCLSNVGVKGFLGVPRLKFPSLLE